MGAHPNPRPVWDPSAGHSLSEGSGEGLRVFGKLVTPVPPQLGVQRVTVPGASLAPGPPCCHLLALLALFSLRPPG